jgi:hypothetical protein
MSSRNRAPSTKKGGAPPSDKDKEKERPKRRGGFQPPPHHRGDEDDDDDVDASGNVRGLIDYDYDEGAEATDDAAEARGDDDGGDASSVSAPPSVKAARPAATSGAAGEQQRPQRKAKAKAERKIKRLVSAGSSEASSDSSFRPPAKARRGDTDKAKPARAAAAGKHRRDDDDAKKKPAGKAKAKAKARLDDDEEEAATDETTTTDASDYSGDSDDDDDDESDDESADDESDESEDEDAGRRRGKRRRSSSVGSSSAIEFLFQDAMMRDPMQPQKYKMKHEPPSVRRFVKLLRKSEEVGDDEGHIDNDIAYFKALPADKQTALLGMLQKSLEPPTEPEVPLKLKLMQMMADRPELQRVAMAKYGQLCSMEPGAPEASKLEAWISGFARLPIGVYKALPVTLDDGPERCAEFMGRVKGCMDEAIYGHDEAKLQIMQFVAAWVANPGAAGNVIAIHGPPGIGKTSIIKGVAKALDNRPVSVIAMGGTTDSAFIEGHSYTYEGAVWGRIADILMHSKCMNPIIVIEEIDKLSATPKGDEIMNMLVHITDPSQNERWHDKYFAGVPLDLSRVLFVLCHNDHSKLSPILRDRMYSVPVRGFSLADKCVIAETHLLPAVLREVGLFEKLSLPPDVLRHVIEEYAGHEEGVRDLKRALQTIAGKANMLRFLNDKKRVPFAIEGFALPFTVTRAHCALFLSKAAPALDPSVQRMYT